MIHILLETFQEQKFDFSEKFQFLKFCLKNFLKFCHHFFHFQIPWDEERAEKDPFQDIAIGGIELPCQVQGYVSVWALTFSGKVSTTFMPTSMSVILYELQS